MSNTKGKKFEAVQEDESEQQNEKGKEIISTESLPASGPEVVEVEDTSAVKIKHQSITSP